MVYMSQGYVKDLSMWYESGIFRKHVNVLCNRDISEACLYDMRQGNVEVMSMWHESGICQGHACVL